MQFLPFGYYNRDEDEPWREPIRLLKIFAIFATILVIVWGLGAVVLAVKDEIPRWGWIPDE